MHIPLVNKDLPENGNEWRSNPPERSTTMGERPLILRAAQILLAVVFGGAVLFTTILVSSTVWGMATGNHFQGYLVPVEWSVDDLAVPDVADSDVSLRGISVPLEGSVSVDFGQGWHRWLVLEAVRTLLTGAAVAIAAWLFLRLVRDVGRGVRLHERHGAALTTVGILALVTPLLAAALTSMQPALIEGGSVVSSAPSVELPLFVPAAGFVLIVLGSVLRHAASIEEEHSLTV